MNDNLKGVVVGPPDGHPADTASDVSPSRFPRLEFTQQGQARLDEVRRFLLELEERAHPHSEEIAVEFLSRLIYLNGFGGSVSDEDARPRFRVVLGRDFAPLSFTLTWLRLVSATGEYTYAFNGGLIWHGGGNDPLCISLTPQFWGIHT